VDFVILSKNILAIATEKTKDVQVLGTYVEGNWFLKRQTNKKSKMSTSPKQFKLILVDVQKELCDHWRVAFDVYPDVEIHDGYFQWYRLGNQKLLWYGHPI